MTPDLSKLTPAPFVPKYTRQTADELLAGMRSALAKGGPVCFLVDCESIHPEDTEPMTVAFFGNGPAGETNSLFFALARNAFDVMMRRKWWTDCSYDGKRWCVRGRAGYIGVSGKDVLHWPDPFTALVEADRWYKENVEAKGG